MAPEERQGGGREQPGPDLYKTRTQIVFETLRDEIMLGSLMLGDELRQDEIAERFRVSRIPVREALRMLAMEKLVELRPHHKAVVRAYSRAEIEDIFMIRSLLESKAAALACARLGPADLEALQRHLAEMEGLYQPADLVRYLQANRAFHMTIYRLAGSPILENLIAHFIDQSSRFIHIYLKATETFAKAHAEHLEIYRACEARDPAVLEQLTRDHVRQTLGVLHESAFQALTSRR
jgi:DNA-binding GntR family transcriptional regulator